MVMNNESHYARSYGKRNVRKKPGAHFVRAVPEQQEKQQPQKAERDVL